MFLVPFPLLIIPLALYNIIAFLMPGVSWTDRLAAIPLLSRVEWTMTFGDALVMLALLLLFLEIIKAAGTATKSVVDHLLAAVVFIAAAVEFLMVPQAANSTFALLVVVCLVDLMGGITIGLRAPRRARPVEKIES